MAHRLFLLATVCLAITSAFPACHYKNKKGQEFNLEDKSITDYEWKGTPVGDYTPDQRWEFRLCGGLVSTKSVDQICDPSKASVCQFWGDDEGVRFSATIFGSEWVYSEPQVSGSTLSMVSIGNNSWSEPGQQSAVINLFCGKTSIIQTPVKDTEGTWRIMWTHPLACEKAVSFADSSALVKITEKSNNYQMKLWNRDEATAAVVKNSTETILYWNFYNNATFYAYTLASGDCQLSNDPFVDFVPVIPTFTGARDGAECTANGKTGKSTIYSNGITVCANKTQPLSYSNSDFKADVTFFTQSVPEHGQFNLPFACTIILKR